MSKRKENRLNLKILAKSVAVFFPGIVAIIPLPFAFGSRGLVFLKNFSGVFDTRFNGQFTIMFELWYIIPTVPATRVF